MMEQGFETLKVWHKLMRLRLIFTDNLFRFSPPEKTRPKWARFRVRGGSYTAERRA
jgi:hypothetical protein